MKSHDVFYRTIKSKQQDFQSALNETIQVFGTSGDNSQRQKAMSRLSKTAIDLQDMLVPNDHPMA